MQPLFYDKIYLYESWICFIITVSCLFKLQTDCKRFWRISIPPFPFRQNNEDPAAFARIKIMIQRCLNWLLNYAKTNYAMVSYTKQTHQIVTSFFSKIYGNLLFLSMLSRKKKPGAICHNDKRRRRKRRSLVLMKLFLWVDWSVRLYREIQVR